MSEEERECMDCKHYNCYDDGDGRWDVWCEHFDTTDNEFDITQAEICPFYLEERWAKE